ncbi:MAG: hypothetical protein AAF413_00790 [Patescibacteria group bacterium]
MFERYTLKLDVPDPAAIAHLVFKSGEVCSLVFVPRCDFGEQTLSYLKEGVLDDFDLYHVVSGDQASVYDVFAGAEEDDLVYITEITRLLLNEAQRLETLGVVTDSEIVIDPVQVD